MQIDAIYENGIIKPQVPLRLKQKRVKVQIIIPDVSIDHRPVKQGALRSQINEILGTYGHARQGATPEQDKATCHEHLVEKYGK